MTIFIVLAIVAALILGFAASKPNSFRIERAITIKAPASKIYAVVNDLKKGELWSPWETIDPDMNRTYSANTVGVGATYSWDGDKNIGAGRQEILESLTNSKVKIKLDFFKPFKANNFAEFILVPQGDSTHVTWAMYGPQPFMGKLMSVFINCGNKFVGPQFEKGLVSLKAITEQP